MPSDTGSKQAREKVITLLTAREIFDLVRDDLVLVEQELTRHTSAAFEPVSEITSYLLGGGGKRLLTLAARQAQIIGLAPRLVPLPVRMPLPPAQYQGSIYENQRAAGRRYFATSDDAPRIAAE